ncbi:MAG: MFS transporter [Caldilineales bacterium]|nr:MFS transporter [Caldilineales bacterium]
MRSAAGILNGKALAHFLGLAILVRLVRDTGVRMMYPYLSAYAVGLGVSLTTMGSLLALRNGLLLLAPLFGHLADRGGPRRYLLVGFLLLGAGMSLLGWGQGLTVALVAFLLLGVADAINTALMQAYVSEHVGPAVRGRALATVEYAWAITGIAVLPFMGWLLANVDAQAPFRLMGLAAVGAWCVLAFVMPGDPPRAVRRSLSLWAQMGSILRDRSALASVLVNAFVFIAVESFFVVWGAHLVRRFGFHPGQVGFVAVVIGLAELGGSVLSSVIIDRVGKRRGTLAGVLAFALVLALMPWFDRSLPMVVVGLALASLCLEYSVVSSIPLLGEKRTTSRASVFALGVMAAALTRSVSAPVAVWLFEHIAFIVAMGYAVAALLVALWLLWRHVEERPEP